MLHLSRVGRISLNFASPLVRRMGGLERLRHLVAPPSPIQQPLAQRTVRFCTREVAKTNGNGKQVGSLGHVVNIGWWFGASVR